LNDCSKFLFYFFLFLIKKSFLKKVHEWRAYNNDDEPARKGVSAGLWDVDNQAYVGKVFDGEIWRAARIQVPSPGSGTYGSLNGEYHFFQNGGYYLVNNPNYHYYWVDTYIYPWDLTNAVKVPMAVNGSFVLNVGRLQANGQVFINRANSLGFPYTPEGGMETYVKNYQTLVCDPRPANKCSKFIKVLI
jgi:hypothetical protein